MQAKIDLDWMVQETKRMRCRILELEHALREVEGITGQSMLTWVGIVLPPSLPDA